MEHASLSSLAAVADATLAPTSPHGSEADWDFVDESAAKEIEIQRQSDNLRVQEMGATQQLMPLDQAHPGGIDDASLQQMAVPWTELRTSLHPELRYRPYRASWQLRRRKSIRMPSASRLTRWIPTG